MASCKGDRVKKSIVQDSCANACIFGAESASRRGLLCYNVASTNQRLKHLRPTRRSSSQSGVKKSQWETSGGGGSSWNGSPDCRRRRARSARPSILMGCGPSPPRRSPADDATSPASRSISSSSARRPFDPWHSSGRWSRSSGSWRVDKGWVRLYTRYVVAVPEEHAPPDGRDRRVLGRWEAQRSKLDHAPDPLQ